ncbi:MAG: hypothetical protein JWO44_2409 [Bacteroidetes bacterium]|nr:hypothetical protein [Bacteroidota bacterium]
MGYHSFMPKKKRLRTLIYVVLGIILLVLLGASLLGLYLDKRIVTLLKEKVSTGSNGEYALSVDDLSIHLLAHSVTVKNLIIAPTGKSNPTEKATYVFKAAVLRISGFSVMSYMKRKDLELGSIECEKPQISIFQGKNRFPKAKKTPDAAPFSLFKLMSPQLNSLDIDRIDIQNSQFNIYRDGTDTLSLMSAKESSISIHKFSVNKETDEAERLFFAEKFEIVMNKFAYHVKDGLYTLFGKSLYASYTDSVVKIDSFQLIPNYPKSEFGKMADRQVTRVEIVAPEISFKKIDVKSFLEQNWLVAGRLDVTGGNVVAYRDNNVPLKPIVRPSLQSMLRDVPFFISIDTVTLKDVDIVSESVAEGSAAAGIMTLDRLRGTVTGLQNDSTLFTDKSSIRATLDAVFMKQGNFHAEYNFPLSTRSELCYCSGSLSPIDIQILNPLLSKAKNLNVKTGRVDSLRFSFTAKGDLSVGKMTLAYHDLTAELIPEKDEKNIKTVFKNFVANQLVLRRSNPGKDGVLRVVEIRAERNPYRYFPYFFMQSLLSGITASIEGEQKSRFLKRTRLLDKK